MKTKTNRSFIFKGFVLVLVFALAILCAPIDGLVALAQMSSYTDYSFMTIGKLEDEVKTTVTKGEKYTISEAYVGGNADYVVGRLEENDAISDGVTTANIVSSEVTVKYSSLTLENLADTSVVEGTTDVTNKVVVRSENADAQAEKDDASYGYFIADKVGTYTVTYSYTYTAEVDGQPKEFTNTYELNINSELSSASISFENNQKDFIPSVIDLAQLKTDKNLYIPAAKVTDEDEEEVEVTYVRSKAEVGATGAYIVVTATGGIDAKDITISKEEGGEGRLYIAGSVFKDVAYGAGKYTIRYAYYEDGEFITSTTKSTQVYANNDNKINNYYKDGKYELKLELASSWSDNGQTGVEATLPAAKGVTSKDTNPASENVDVYYRVKVYHSATGSANAWEALDADLYNAEEDENGDPITVVDADGYLVNPSKFKPLKDGYYTFEYEITDFYGNVVKSQKGVYSYKDIKDEQAPTPIIYDASQYVGTNATNEKVDETYKLQSRSVPNGVVVYAIGMKDNVSKVGDEGTYLTRTIMTDETVSKLTINKYNEYNLVFNYRNGTNSEAFESLRANNALIRKSTTVDVADSAEDNYVNSDTAMLAWLNANGYKVVVDNANTEKLYEIFSAEGYFDTLEIYETAASDADKKTASIDWLKSEASLEKGFAYVDVDETFGATSGENGMGSGSYRIVYTAQDAAGTTKEISRSMYIGSYDDVDYPEIRFSTTLSDTYLPDATVTFDVPTASDNYDTNMSIKTLYRFLKSDGSVVTVTEDEKTISNNDLTQLQADLAGVKDSKDASVLLTDKYADYFTASAAGYVDLTDKDASSYSIDLAQGTDAVKLQIVTYVYDDCGNVNMYGDTVNIANVTDNAPPVFDKIDTKDDAFVRDYYVSDEIELPTLVVRDDAVAYMSYEVNVYHVKNGSRTEISTYGAYAEPETLNSKGAGTYTVHPGKFVAPFAGEYQVSIAVKDSTNKTVVTFVTYNVENRNLLQDPTINVSIDAQTVELDTAPVISIPTPSISYENSESTTYDKKDVNTDKTYIVRGVNEDGQATNYSTKFGSANSFTPSEVGEYNIQYTAKLEVYNRDIFTFVEMGEYDPDANGGIGAYVEGGYFTQDGNSEACIKTVSENEYQVYAQADSSTIYRIVREDGSYKVYVGNSVDPLDEMTIAMTPVVNALDFDQLFAELKCYKLTSETYTVIVKDSTGPVIAEYDYEYSEEKPMSIETFNEDGITVYGLQATDKGSNINASKSKVVLSWKLANGESGSKTYNGEELYKDNVYKKTSTTGKTYDGTYTVTYTAYDNNGNSSTKSYKIAVGDAIAPTVTLEDGFGLETEKTFEIGTELKIDISKISVVDNKDLPEGTKPTITLINTADNKEIEAKENGNIYAFDLNEVGSYKLTIEVEDAVGNKTSYPVEFEVTAKNTDSSRTYKAVGIVLIVVSVLILAGVIVYFIVSKVKLDKELKK